MMLIDSNTTAPHRPVKRVATEPMFANAAAQQSARELLDQIIRVRAFELFLLRGDTHGSATEDWLQAEREYIGEDVRQPALVRHQAPEGP
jgi:Protein of unknown function (DUF2934)